MAASYKTPGVYVEEVSLLPTSVAQVETALPVFIGYTETYPEGNDPSTDKFLVTKISSKREFEDKFGKGYTPRHYKVGITSNQITSVLPDIKYHTYESVSLFYDNGGGDCFVVSMGKYNADASDFAGNAAAGVKTAIKNALPLVLTALKMVDEPTILICPDVVNLRTTPGGTTLDYPTLGSIHSLMLAHCATMQDRFAVLDMLGAHTDAVDGSSKDCVDYFRDNVGTSNLSYGATYFPNVLTTYSPEVRYSQIMESTGSNRVAAILGLSSNDNDLLALWQDTEQKAVDFDRFAKLAKEYKAGAATTLTFTLTRQSNGLEAFLLDAQNRVATATTAATARTALNDWVKGISNICGYLKTLDDAVLGFTSLTNQRNLDTLKSNTELVDSVTSFCQNLAHLRATADFNTAGTAIVGDTFSTILAADTTPDWRGALVAGASVGSIAALPTIPEKCLAALNLLKSAADKLVKHYNNLYSSVSKVEKTAEDLLFQQHPFFKNVLEKATFEMRMMPPSGAVVGVYASVDRTRGVWKSPANVSLNSVIGPAVVTSDKAQERLNIHVTGKSVNAIRSFSGKGSLIWGARTLAGNDNEWRYISVRRFFMMVEESVKKATEPFVFEPNDANTWLKASVMIENYLTNLWRQGALAGAKPKDAFFVHCGLGSTMTSQDVLEGRMIVEIGMAAVRPAEFIILRFSHMMATS